MAVITVMSLLGWGREREDTARGRAASPASGNAAGTEERSLSDEASWPCLHAPKVRVLGAAHAPGRAFLHVQSMQAANTDAGACLTLPLPHRASLPGLSHRPQQL